MFNGKIFRVKFVCLGLIGALLLLFYPVEALVQTSQDVGTMVGFVYGDDLKTPVENAVVKIRNIEDGKEYQSIPTDEIGLYKITGIGEGRYVLGVSAEVGDFNFDYVLYIKANEMAKLSLALKPGSSMLQEKEEEKEGEKEKESDKKKEKKSFFARPLGIAVIAALSGLGILGTIAIVGPGGRDTVSPAKKKK